MLVEWNAPVPSSAKDGVAMLFFCVASCVHQRFSDRDQEQQKQQNDIKLVAQKKAETGCRLQACDIDSPSNSYFAPCEPSPFNGFGNAEGMTLFDAAVAQRRLHATASWLFDFLHDDPVVMRIQDCRMGPDCPAYACSAVGPLRASCTLWAKLLPLLHCCDCGGDYRIGDFRGWWGFIRQGSHGPVPCQECYNICTYHLSCYRCNKRNQKRITDRMRCRYSTRSKHGFLG